MRQKSQSGLTYFACLLVLNLLAGGAIATARSVNAQDPFSLVSFQAALSKINSGEKTAALTRPGECDVGTVLCAHDAPKKEVSASLDAASTGEAGSKPAL